MQPKVGDLMPPGASLLRPRPLWERGRRSFRWASLCPGKRIQYGV